MKTYRALVTLPRIGQTPVTIEARSTYEARAKLEAMYGVGNVTADRCTDPQRSRRRSKELTGQVVYCVGASVDRVGSRSILSYHRCQFFVSDELLDSSVFLR